MHKKRSVRADVADAIELEIRTRPDIPILFGHAGGGRAEPKKIDHHQLAVAIPAAVDEAAFGSPAHDHGLIAMEQPVPVDALEELRSKAGDFRVVKIGAAGQNAAQENGRIDGRDFGLEDAFTILDIEKVTEKTMRLGNASAHETQSSCHAIANSGAVFPTTMAGDGYSQRSADGKATSLAEPLPAGQLPAGWSHRRVRSGEGDDWALRSIRAHLTEGRESREWNSMRRVTADKTIYWDTVAGALE